LEARLARVQGWWDDHRRGRPVPEAPEPELLARALISALDIARQADYAREDWVSALGRLDATLAVQQALKRPAEDLGATRLNRSNVLAKLPGRLGEAKAELEDCLALFAANPAMQAKALGSLTDPGFAALEQWLRQRRIDPAALQADIDAFLDQARDAASGPSGLRNGSTTTETEEL
jgi:hypothetical protein